jgi:hypothetical protein
MAKKGTSVVFPAAPSAVTNTGSVPDFASVETDADAFVWYALMAAGTAIKSGPGSSIAVMAIQGAASVPDASGKPFDIGPTILESGKLPDLSFVARKATAEGPLRAAKLHRAPVLDHHILPKLDFKPAAERKILGAFELTAGDVRWRGARQKLKRAAKIYLALKTSGADLRPSMKRKAIVYAHDRVTQLLPDLSGPTIEWISNANQGFRERWPPSRLKALRDDLQMFADEAAHAATEYQQPGAPPIGIALLGMAVAAVDVFKGVTGKLPTTKALLEIVATVLTDIDPLRKGSPRDACREALMLRRGSGKTPRK